MRTPILFFFLAITSHAFAQSSDAVFRSDGGRWAVGCTGTICQAWNGWVTIRFENDGFSIDPVDGRRLLHVHNRFAQPLETDRRLDLFAVETLKSSGRFVAIDSGDASIIELEGVSIGGLAGALDYMSANLLGAAPNPYIDYRAVEEDRFTSQSTPQLLPFTKPQIEFALRAQTQDD